MREVADIARKRDRPMRFDLQGRRHAYPSNMPIDRFKLWCSQEDLVNKQVGRADTGGPSPCVVVLALSAQEDRPVHYFFCVI